MSRRYLAACGLALLMGLTVPATPSHGQSLHALMAARPAARAEITPVSLAVARLATFPGVTPADLLPKRKPWLPEPPILKASLPPRLLARYLPPPAPYPFAERVMAPAARGLTAETCLALAMYWEARGEGVRGMRAVGHVVRNRVRSRRFPNTVCGVVKQGGAYAGAGCHFNWRCDGRSDAPQSRRSWVKTVELARAILSGRDGDLTEGAVFFHAPGERKSWTRGRQQTLVIGAHAFFR